MVDSPWVRRGFGAIFKRSPLVGTFFAIYGSNDALFMRFFGWVFLRSRPVGCGS